MKGSAILISLACVLYVHAEPPVGNYLPPLASNVNVGASFGVGTQAFQKPSSQYGPPNNAYSPPNNAYSPPNNAYAPPNNAYVPPSSQYGPPHGNNNNYNPSGNFGSAGVTTAVFKPQPTYGAPSSGNYNGAGNGAGNGYNNGYENNEPARYSFEYNVQDYPSGNDFGHMETRDGDKTTGRYYVLLPDGRKQIVNYEADQNGYRPTITYEQTNAAYNNNAQQSSKFNGY